MLAALNAYSGETASEVNSHADLASAAISDGVFKQYQGMQIVEDRMLHGIPGTELAMPVIYIPTDTMRLWEGALAYICIWMQHVECLHLLRKDGLG